LSEETFLGIAGGLALCGEKAIVEIMFGDFLALGYDQLLNFASKATAMYGRPLTINLVVRCPVGGNRAYGPTHSQSMQKYFLGIPNLQLFEVSPFHDNCRLLNKLVNLGQPCILFEDKVLYTQRMAVDGVVDDYFLWESLDTAGNFVRVFLDGEGTSVPDCLLIAPGGMVTRCLQAMKDLFLSEEISTQLIVPSQLYPFDIKTLVAHMRGITRVAIIEESVPGGTWGCEVAQQLYTHLWGVLEQPVQLIHSRESVIPTASHLEKQVIVQAEDITRALREAMHATN
jgi:pyruvate dehydrogenase E1 component beta subunit